MQDSLKKRYSVKLLANVISGIIAVIMISIVPKALGPVAYGQFIYLQDFFMKIMTFLDMGSSIAFFTKLSAQHTRKELITFYFIYSLSILLLVITFIFFIDYLGFTKFLLPDISSKYIYMGLSFGFLTWFTIVLIRISDAYALTVSIELIKIAHKFVSLLLLLCFVFYMVFDLDSYFLFNYIALLSFLFILNWFFIKKGIFTKSLLKIKNLEFKILAKEFIDYCSPLVIYSFIGVFVGLFDIWLLQKMGGSIQTGYYGLAYAVSAVCFLFTGAMTPIITREFSKSYGEKDLEQMRKLFFRYIPMLYSIAAYFGIFISFQSENILAVFTDEKFADAYLVLVIMALYPIHQTYGQLSGSMFYATGQTKLIRNMAFITYPIGLILSFIFMYVFELEAVGLAIKMVVGQVIGVNILLYFNAKYLNIKIKYFVLHQIYSIIFFTIIAWMSSRVIDLNSSIIEFLVSGVLYTTLVIILSYVFPQIFATNREEIKLNLLRLKNVAKK